MTDHSSMIDRPDQAWEWMRQSREVPTSVDWTRPDVIEAWERCMHDYELHLDQDIACQYAANNITWSDSVYSLLTTTIFNLQEFLQQSNINGSLLLLCKNASLVYVMDSGMDSSFLTSRDKQLLKIGADWSEKAIGNNGFGTAAYLARPIHFEGKDHYYHGLHKFCSIGYPLLAPDGNMLGILGLLGGARGGVSTLMPFMELALLNIECILITRQIDEDKVILRLRPENMQEGVAIGYVGIDGLVVVDHDSNIIGLNQPAIAAFGANAHRDILNSRIENHLGISLQNLYKALQKSKGPVKVLSDRGITLLVETTPAHVEQITNPRMNSAAINSLASGNGSRKGNEGTQQLNRLDIDKYSQDKSDAVNTKRKYIDKDGIQSTLINKACSLQNASMPILVTGESGVGKEYLVQLIHEKGPRKNGPLVVINCASIPRDLVESELFGYESGSFTGAASQGKQGKFKLANGGTIFLDEIGDMPLELQGSLLRVLDTLEITPIGGIKSIPVDVQVVAATNADLRKSVTLGSFRKDLYYRLNGAQLCLPPLRERPDKKYLINRILKQESKLCGLESEIRMENDVWQIFLKHSWPGNVRELKNVIKNALFTSDGIIITINDLPLDFIEELPLQTNPESLNSNINEQFNNSVIERTDNQQNIQQSTNPINQNVTQDATIGIDYDPNAHRLKTWEVKVVSEAINKAGGNVAKAARLLGVTRATLYRKMRRYDISHP